MDVDVLKVLNWVRVEVGMGFEWVVWWCERSYHDWFSRGKVMLGKGGIVVMVVITIVGSSPDKGDLVPNGYWGGGLID